jgi:mannosyltransferase
VSVALEEGTRVHATALTTVPDADRRRWRVDRTAVCLTGLVLATLLLVWQRLRVAYWIDEGLTVGIASHSIPSIPGVLVKDGSPPLYYLLLAAWTRLFGTGEIATHALSTVIALAVVPVAFWAGSRLFDRRAGWFAAIFAAFCPFVTYFAGETRMYSLVVLESLVLCVGFSLAFVERTERGPWAFAGALVALEYTHYWGLYAAVGAALAVAALAYASPARRELVRPAVIGFGGAALAFVPWLPVFLGQLRSTGAPWSHTPALREVVTEVSALVRDERVLVVLVLAVGAGVAATITTARRRADRWYLTADLVHVAAFALIGVTPIVIGWVASHAQPSWATRYLAVVVGPLILIVGFGLSRARASGVVALVIMIAISVQPFTRISPGIDIATTSKSNVSAIADALAPKLHAGAVVLVAQPEAVPLFAHYLGDSMRYADPRGVVDDPDVMDWRDAAEALDAATVPGALQGTLDAVTAGDQVVLVTSATTTADSDTDWIRRFRQLGREWQIFLAHRPCLRAVASVAPAPSQSDERSAYPYRAILLECR